MDSDNGSHLDTELTGPQAELLELLGKLVSLVATDNVAKMQPVPEVCKKADRHSQVSNKPFFLSSMGGYTKYIKIPPRLLEILL